MTHSVKYFLSKTQTSTAYREKYKFSCTKCEDDGWLKVTTDWRHEPKLGEEGCKTYNWN